MSQWKVNHELVAIFVAKTGHLGLAVNGNWQPWIKEPHTAVDLWVSLRETNGAEPFNTRSGHEALRFETMPSIEGFDPYELD